MFDFHNFGHIWISFKTILSFLFFDVSLFFCIFEGIGVVADIDIDLLIFPSNPYIIPLFMPSVTFSTMLSVTIKTSVSKRIQPCLYPYLTTLVHLRDPLCTALQVNDLHISFVKLNIPCGISYCDRICHISFLLTKPRAFSKYLQSRCSAILQSTVCAIMTYRVFVW